MSISLILIGIISVVVIGGTAYLLQSKSEELSESKKSMIMLIVGSVIFVSFIVTSMKHPNLHKASLISASNYNTNHLFHPESCKYDNHFKYSSYVDLPSDVITQIYERNYVPIQKRQSVSQQESASQNIMFLSKKDEGASHFISELASQKCKSSHPTLYLKLQQKIKDEGDLVQQLGFNSYQQFKNSICFLSGIEIKRTSTAIEYVTKGKPNKLPYIIIDNFQYLNDALATQTHYIEQDLQDDTSKHRKYTTKQRLIYKIVSELMGKCKANLILNSQHAEAIEQLHEIWQQNTYRKQEYFPFEFHEWEGMRHYDVYKIVVKLIDKSDYTVSQILSHNKKDTYSFDDLFAIIKQVQTSLAKSKSQSNTFKRLDSSLKQSSIKLNVARYFGLEKVYKQIRSADTKTISYFRSKLPFQQLLKLQNLNLISIKNGRIFTE